MSSDRDIVGVNRSKHDWLRTSGMYMKDVDCLILTTGHHPDDGRLNRHVAVLRQEGVNTVLMAVEIRRSLRLIAAPLVVFRSLRAVRPAAVVFPDPELFVVGPLVARWMGVRSILDVHEDYQAVALSRDWIPGVLRTGVGSVAAAMVQWGRRLASATIVAAPHLSSPGDQVVPNIPDEGFFPAPGIGEPRMTVVYVGDITESRGILEMLEIIKLVPDVELELIGPVTPRTERLIRDRAFADGTSERITITGRLPYDQAWDRAVGAIAGLSLLLPTPAYSESIPSKLWEYMAAGLPIIASDLPGQRSLIEESESGVVITSAADGAATIREWVAHPQRAVGFGVAGRTYYRSASVKARGTESLLTAVLGS